MVKWVQKIINVLLPPRCLLCGKILHHENGLCEKCFSKINFIGQPICKKCGNPIPSGENTKTCPICVNDNKNPFRLQRSMVCYDENVSPLLIEFKFFDKTENAAFLARWLYVAGHDIWAKGVDIIVPVPLHKARLRHRRYNQSALLCKELSKLTKIPVDYTSLIRHKNTKPQVKCKATIRKQNVKNAFKVRYPKKFENKRILIIDDMYNAYVRSNNSGIPCNA